MCSTGNRRRIGIRSGAGGNRASVAHGQGGFVTRIDLLVILILVPALAAAGWLTFRKAYGLRYESPPACLSEIEEIADRIGSTARLKVPPPSESIGAAKCPLTGAPYSVQVQAGRWRICCLDPGNHLGIGFPASCRSENGWLQAASGEGSGPGKVPVSPREAFLSPVGWSVEKGPENRLRIERFERWSRILPAAALAILLPYAGILIGVLYLNSRESGRRSTLKTILTVPPVIASVGLCYAIWLGVWSGGVWLLLSSQEAAFDQNAMVLTSRLFPSAGKREVVDRGRILAVGEEDGTFVAFRDDKGLLKAWRMRLTDAGEAHDLARAIRNALAPDPVVPKPTGSHPNGGIHFRSFGSLL